MLGRSASEKVEGWFKLPWFAIIVLGALLVRVTAAIVYPQELAPWSDWRDYDGLARNLLNGHGFSLSSHPPYEPTMFREPIYPAFLALAYALPGNDIMAAKTLQILLSALTCGIVYWTALEVGLRRRTAVFAGALAAVHPGLALYSGRIMSESIGAFTFALAMWLLARAWRSERALDFALAGGGIGLATLTKSAMLPMIAFLPATYALVTFFQRQSERARQRAEGPRLPRAVGLAALYMVAAGCTLAPWSLRNQLTLGSPAITVRGGEVMWARAHAMVRARSEGATTDMFDSVHGQMYRHLATLRKEGLSEPEADAAMGKEGFSIILANPMEYLQGHFHELRGLWICSPESRTLGNGGNSCTALRACLTSGLRSLAVPAFVLQALLIFGGALLFVFRPGPGLAVAAPVLLISVMYSFFVFMSCRYAVPILPAAVILGAHGASTAWDAIRRRLSWFRARPASAS